MKKLAAIASCAVLVGCLAIAGCANNSSAPEEEPAAEEEVVGMPNPWSEVADPAEAAAIAGFDFEVNAAPLPDATPFSVTYRAMEGCVEVVYDNGANMVTVRKGTMALAENGDISGDYNTYPAEWTQAVDSLSAPVACFGPVMDKAAKAIWTEGDYAYSLYAQALGGDQEYGLDSAAVAAYVNALK